MIEEEGVFYSQVDPEWVNKSRTLVVSSRGMTAAQRSFMLALFALMPHAKKDCKLEKHGNTPTMQMSANRLPNSARHSKPGTSCTSRSSARCATAYGSADTPKALP
jgi:hypothetical protein